MNNNYVQIVPQSDKQKFKMYMRLPKKDLANMLINANKFIDGITPIHVQYTGTGTEVEQKWVCTIQ